MPLHDWARVDAGIFHDFHNVWNGELRTFLNNGGLPGEFYAMTEQHAGQFVADVLTLHASAADEELSLPDDGGGLLLAEAPPKVRHKLTADESYAQLRKTLAIRHVSGHRLVALIEIVSPANKDRAANVEQFVSKAVEALDAGVHVMVIDVFAPGRHDPRGMPGAVWSRYGQAVHEVPADEPSSFATFVANPRVEAYLDYAPLGGSIPEMPLFLTHDRYVPCPLEAAYESAYRGVPAYWRNVVEGG